MGPSDLRSRGWEQAWRSVDDSRPLPHLYRGAFLASPVVCGIKEVSLESSFQFLSPHFWSDILPFEPANQKRSTLLIIATRINHWRYDRPCLFVHSLGSIWGSLRSPETTIHGTPHTERHHITVPDTIILDAERGARDRDLPLNVTFATARVMTEESRTPETDTAKGCPDLVTREKPIESPSPMETATKDTGENFPEYWKMKGTGDMSKAEKRTIGTEDSQRGERGMAVIGALLSQGLFTDSQGRLSKTCKIEWMVTPDAARRMTASKCRQGVIDADRRTRAQRDRPCLAVLPTLPGQLTNIVAAPRRIQLQGRCVKARHGHRKPHLRNRSHLMDTLTCTTRTVGTPKIPAPAKRVPVIKPLGLPL